MTIINKSIKIQLITSLVLFASLPPVAVSAEHIDFTGRDSVFAMYGSQTPRSKVFSDYYTKNIFYPSTVTMLVYDGLSGNGQIAMENWFDNTPLSNDTHMRFAMTTNYNSAHLRFVQDSTPCDSSLPAGCWNPTVLSADSSRNAYHWFRGNIEMKSSSIFASIDDYRAAITHEVGHALGLHEQYNHIKIPSCEKHQNNGSNPPTLVTSFHSIMESGESVNGKIQHCDRAALIPTTWDFIAVKRLMGYSLDSNETNYYVLISKDSTGVTYYYNDERAADAFTLVKYFWSNSQNSGFTGNDFAEEIMQNQPGPHNLKNGTNADVEYRVLQQKFNPSNWGINNKYISVCVYGYANSSTISQHYRCSAYSIWWP